MYKIEMRVGDKVILESLSEDKSFEQMQEEVSNLIVKAFEAKPGVNVQIHKMITKDGVALIPHTVFQNAIFVIIKS